MKGGRGDNPWRNSVWFRLIGFGEVSWTVDVPPAQAVQTLSPLEEVAAGRDDCDDKGSHGGNFLAQGQGYQLRVKFSNSLKWWWGGEGRGGEGRGWWWLRGGTGDLIRISPQVVGEIFTLSPVITPHTFTTTPLHNHKNSAR